MKKSVTVSFIVYFYVKYSAMCGDCIPKWHTRAQLYFCMCNLPYFSKNAPLCHLGLPLLAEAVSTHPNCINFEQFRHRWTSHPHSWKLSVQPTEFRSRLTFPRPSPRHSTDSSTSRASHEIPSVGRECRPIQPLSSSRSSLELVALFTPRYDI